LASTIESVSTNYATRQSDQIAVMIKLVPAFAALWPLTLFLIPGTGLASNEAEAGKA
jgi:hypothetical protein